MPPAAERSAGSPDAPAVVSPTGTRTSAELDANANRLARALRRRGLRPGDAVALICGNRSEFVEVVQACRRSGLRLTPINWHLTGGEVAYITADCDAKALIADAPRGEVARVALAGSPACAIALGVGGPIDSFEGYPDAIADEAPDALDDPAPGGTMLYTSGTTGRPKGVYRPPEAVPPLPNVGGHHEGSTHLCTGPLYHAAPLAFSLTIPRAFGASIVLMEAWDAEESLRLIEEHRVTHTHMVPTMFHRLLLLPDAVRDKYDISSLRYVIHGAAPCPVPIKRRMIEWLGPIVHEYYAATEGVGTIVDSATWLERPGTVGRPLRPGQVIVGDEDANPLPAGETGLVYLRGRGAAHFVYFKDDDKTASTFRGDYFTLGDVGHMDEDGFLYLTDRSSDLIVSGGVNVYPAEVDAVLLEHPAVGDAATIGLPDEDWGEVVVAVVELQAGLTASAALGEELIAFCRERIAHYKCPRRVEFTSSLPRQDNGKIYRRVLREKLRTEAKHRGSK